MKLGFRGRFLIPTVVLIVLGMSFSASIGGMMAKRYLRDSIEARLNQVTDLTNQRITDYFRDRKIEVRRWSRLDVFRSALLDPQPGGKSLVTACSQLEEIQKEVGHFDRFSIVAPSGEVIGSSTKGGAGVQLGDRAFIQEAFKGNLAVSEALISRVSNRSSVIIACPVKDKEKIIGVFYGAVDISAFCEAFVDSIKVGELGTTFLLQGDGLFLSHPDKSFVMKSNAKDFDFGRKIMAQEEGLVRYVFGDSHKLAAVRTNNETGWLLGVSASEEEIFAPVKKLDYVNICAVLGVSLVAGFIVLLISTRTLKPIKTLAVDLQEAADHVTSASEQISSISQQLAEGASEQAAAIEETSSSLEEMSSMTRQNADNANQANTLRQQVGRSLQEAELTMADLTQAMVEIAGASAETQKIIRTIDEISFQTNLLALNAAVEAARAGEAGAGFAVVAGEVRNLAIRAAEAAKTTSSLIEGTTAKVQRGSDLAVKTRETFTSASSASRKVGELIAEIASASSEQASGIEQINKAVNEMDIVVQQNASSAEESASASAEMNDQALEVRGFAKELIVVMNGKRANGTGSARRNRTSGPGIEEAYRRAAGVKRIGEGR